MTAAEPLSQGVSKALAELAFKKIAKSGGSRSDI